jgi:hypothetical protein
MRAMSAIAVRLPKAIAPPADTPVGIEWEDDVVTVHVLEKNEGPNAGS